MDTKLETLIKISTLKEVHVALLKREVEGGEIVPDNVYEVLKELEQKLNQ